MIEPFKNLLLSQSFDWAMHIAIAGTSKHSANVAFVFLLLVSWSHANTATVNIL